MMKGFRLRPRIVPRTLRDWGSFLLTIVLIPAVYIYEMCIVLPYNLNGCALLYYTIVILGFFVFVNIVTNFFAMVVIDSSIPKEVMSIDRESSDWRFCDDCLSYVPPRAWHCKICKVCILKRDHHCVFTGSCVGHFNHRFFIMFLLFLTIGEVYCVISETLFVSSKINLLDFTVIVKLILPICAVMMGMETFQNEMYLVMYMIVWAGLGLTFVLLQFHVKLILNGQVTPDVRTQNFQFDCGKLRNIMQVLGVKWYSAWCFPFISSSLVCDGINWNHIREWKSENQKNFTKAL